MSRDIRGMGSAPARSAQAVWVAVFPVSLLALSIRTPAQRYRSEEQRKDNVADHREDISQQTGVKLGRTGYRVQSVDGI